MTLLFRVARESIAGLQEQAIDGLETAICPSIVDESITLDRHSAEV